METDSENEKSSENLSVCLNENSSIILKEIKKCSSESLNIFAIPSDHGNFTILKCSSIIVLDGGSFHPNFIRSNAFKNGESPPIWKNILFEKRNLFEIILSDAVSFTAIITHPHTDHFNLLGGFFQLAYEMNNDKKLDNISFFLTSKGNDFSYCSVVAKKYFNKSYYYIRDISKFPLFLNNECYWVRWSLFTNSDLHLVQKIYPNDNREHFNINYGVGTVLFTGDATENTLDSIYGNTKDNNLNTRNISIKNRNILKRTNFLFGPHHGSNTCGSPSLTTQIIKKSKFSFVGIIFFTPYNSSYYHPNSYIDAFEMPMSAKSYYHKISYYRGIQKKSKLTNHAIFLTSESNNGVYWLHLSNDGMFMFSEKYEELTKLVTQNGWSKYTDSLINYLFTNEEKFFDIALRNPNELKVCNALGETPFLHFLNKENSSDTIVIKNMLLVSLLVADDYIHNRYRNYWNMHHPGNRK